MDRDRHQRPIRGTIEKIELYSTILSAVRKLYIYLPPSYQYHTVQRYPVLYMHFGQHLFDPQKPGRKSWQVHRTIEELLEGELITEIIVVGIDAARATVASDYWHTVFYKDQPFTGPLYESFILNEVKPLIDSTFRTLSDRENTAMIGASSGATVSYNIADRNPDVFGKIGMLSPVVRSLDYNTWVYPLPMSRPAFILWIDVGDAEGNYTIHAQELVDVLLTQGYVPNIDFFYYLEPDAAHHETYWGLRLRNPLLLFFGKKGTPVSVTLHGDDLLDVSGNPLTINPIVQYDTGFQTTNLTGNCHVNNPQILYVQQYCRLIGLSEGSTELSFSYLGVETSRSYQVVSSLPNVVKVHLRAHVPQEMPNVDHIYFGSLLLKQKEPKLYEGEYTLPRGFALADSFSCGIPNYERRWDGTPIPFRLLRVREDVEIEYTIEGWSKP
jgi:predicted alpha/beta superfamily hydrolase